MITAICQECGKQFDYDLKPGYPRKYCPECSARKKALFEKKSPQSAPKPQEQAISKHDIVISRTEKPHSYEFGKAGMRHKIYYNDVNELTDHIRILKAAGLVDEDIRDIPD